MTGKTKTAEPLQVFFAYAPEDEELRNKLARHLTQLQRDGLIQAWYDHQITAGTEWKGQIDEHLASAKLILLLISADFLASDYTNDVEVKSAMDRHASKQARVVPIILRACDWQDAPFGKLKSFPSNRTPVTSWDNQDEAFTDIVQGIKWIIQPSSARLSQSPVPISQADSQSNPSTAGPSHMAVPTWIIAVIAIIILLCVGIIIGSVLTSPDTSTPTDVAVATSTQVVAIAPTQPPPTLTAISTPTNVPTPTATATRAPTIAPSSTLTPTIALPIGKIVFSKSEGDRPEDKSIWTVNTDGSDVKKIVSVASAPALSPNGSVIAFIRLNDALYLINSDGSNLRKLVSDGKVRYSEWSHDGQFIAFSLVNSGGIEVVALNNPTQRRRIVSGADNFAWSPDDQSIVYHACRDTCGLYKVGIGGGDGIKLTSDDGQVPAWSPNGKQIVYQKDVSGQRQLFVINADGTGSKQLTSGGAMHVSAAWSADSNYIFYRSPDASGWGIFRMKADGSEPVKIIANADPVDWSFERLAVVTK